MNVQSWTSTQRCHNVKKYCTVGLWVEPWVILRHQSTRRGPCRDATLAFPDSVYTGHSGQNHPEAKPSKHKHICIIFIQRRTNVEDVGPTLDKCYTNVPRLLRSLVKLRNYRGNLLSVTLPCLSIRFIRDETMKTTTHLNHNSKKVKSRIIARKYARARKSVIDFCRQIIRLWQDVPNLQTDLKQASPQSTRCRVINWSAM